MTKPEFMPSGTPDEIDLELMLLGEVDDPGARAAIEAAAAGPLAGAAAEIAQYQEAWRKAPALPVIEPPGQTASPGRTVAWIAAAAAVLLAGAVVWIVVTAPGDNGTPGQDQIRAMGALPVDLTVSRSGEPVTPAMAGFAAGDHLGLAVTIPEGGFLSVASVQDDGVVTVLWHSAEDSPLAAGERFELGGVIELDDYAGREWLVVQLHASSLDTEDLTRQLQQQASELPAGLSPDTSWCFDITRGD